MSFTKVAPAGIGTSPGNSILIGDSLLHSTGIDIGSNTGIGVTIRKHGDATFTGIITASAFFGDGSGLEGVSSSGIGTALSDDDTSSLNKIYYANQELSIGSTVTVNHPDTGIAAYTHYQDLVVKDNADFIVADGDTFIPDVLGINTASLPNPVSGATGGRIRAGTITNAGANGAVNFPNGLTGTAGTFTGNLNVGGVLTYEDVTNVDSLGVGTFRDGLRVTGICTATAFHGDGSALTGVGASFGNSSINSSGIITATSFVPTTGQLSHRNIIINGACLVQQRSTSGSATNGYATVDRFQTANVGNDEMPTQSSFDVSAPGAYHLPTSGPHPYKEGFRKAFGVTNGNQTSGAGAGDVVAIRYSVEAQDIANSGWHYTDSSSFITLSFWVKSSAAQNFYGYLLTLDGTMQRYAFETGALTAFTWKKVVLKIPGNSNITVDNDNGEGFRIEWRPFSGTDETDSGVSLNTWGAFAGGTRTPDSPTTWYTTNDASFQITGVQLEVGPVATPFEHLSFAENKRRCYRYCQRGRHMSSCLVGTPGTYYFTRANIPLFTPMRATVSGTLKAATWNSNRYFGYKTWSSETNVTAAPASVTFSSGSITGVPDILTVNLHVSISSGSSNSPLPANGPGSNNVYPIEYYDVLLEAEL